MTPMTADPVEATALAHLRAAFPNLTQLHQCPGRCGRMTQLVAGHLALCLPCTERELGLSLTENAQRIQYRSSIKAWLKRDVDAELPRLSWARWRQLCGR